MRTLTIKVTGESSEPADRSVPGKYKVEVSEDFDDAKAASCALDVFHSNVAIDCLDHFEVSVLDGQRELEPGDYESYSLTKHGGRLVVKL